MKQISIRDKKKLQTSTAILESARKLFTGQGFENTTMEQIAANAVVATGTLYNYYASKGDILIAIMAEHATRSLAEGSRCQANLADPIAALSEMIYWYTAVFLSLEPNLLGKSIALALENPATMGQRLFSIDRQLITQVEEALREMQTQGRLKSILNVQDTAYLLYSMGFMTILLSYAGVLPSPNSEEYIKRQVTMIIDPWLSDQPKKG